MQPASPPPTLSAATAALRQAQQPQQPVKKPRGPAPRWDSTPFFAGHWVGTRNDWAGDVGCRFSIEADCKITALGRHADTPLAESSVVTLWDADSQEAIASVEVGGSSPIEGNYAFELLSGGGVEVRAGEEYRVTQRCRSGMTDKWFDGSGTADEIDMQPGCRYARFLGGCCRNSYGWPSREDGELRRMGMVNFKVARNPVETVSVTKAQMATAIAKAVTFEMAGDPDGVDKCMSVVANVLGLLVDELAHVAPSAMVLVVVAQEEEIRRLVRLEHANGEEGTSSAYTVFEEPFAARLASFAQQYQGQVDEHGGPTEGSFVVSARSGGVVASAARLLRGSKAVGGAELGSLLGRGLAFARSETGVVTAFLAQEMRKGRALQINTATSSASQGAGLALGSLGRVPAGASASNDNALRG